MKKFIPFLFSTLFLLQAGHGVAERIKFYMPDYYSRKPFLMVGAHFMPIFNGRNLLRTEIDQAFTERYFHEYSYSGGLDIGIFLRKNTTLETGCWYSPRYYLSETEGTFNGGLGKVKTRYIPTYLSIPLSFKFMVREKVGPFLRIGAMVDLLSSLRTESNFYGSATADDMNTLVRKKEDFEKLRTSLILGFGVTLGNLRKQTVYAQVEPLFIYSLTADAKAPYGAYKPYYFGMNLTVGFNFLKKGEKGEISFPEDYYEEEAPAEEEAE